MSDRAHAIWFGLFAANLFAAAVLFATKFVLHFAFDGDGAFILSEFVLLPIVMGIINTFFWRKQEMTVGPCFGYGAVNLLVALVYSSFMMGEGFICIIIVAPLIYTFLMVGIAIGKLLFRRSRTTLQISVVAALASLIAINAITAQPGENQVTDRILIQAPPEVVWQNVTAFPAIDTKPDYWLFRIGLPSPVQSTAEGDYVGAARQCIFSNGIVFEETIVEYEPNRKLTFDITQMPNDPEILGHLELKRGQFILEDNGDGTTTLVGTSWYDLKVKPALYFDWWTQDIIRNVHLEVMEHMKRLAEQA